MKVVAYVPDLMDRSRFSVLDADMTFVRQPGDLDTVGNPDIVIADLGRPGALEALIALDAPRKMGFVSHENLELLAAAAAAGIEAMPRSRFLTRIEQVILKK